MGIFLFSSPFSSPASSRGSTAPTGTDSRPSKAEHPKLPGVAALSGERPKTAPAASSRRGSRGGLFTPRKATSRRARRELEQEHRERLEAEEKKREKERRRQQEDEDVEWRYGQRINSRPAVPLTTPKQPPPPSESMKAKRNKRDDEATAAIEANLPKYVDLLRNVSLFSESALAP